MNKIITTSLFGLICFLSGVVTQYVLPVGSFVNDPECEEKPVSALEIEPPDLTNLAIKKLEITRQAQKITVKILSGENSGSGILIHRQGNVYQVVTNDHVLLYGRQNQAYQIKTSTGGIYPAKIVNHLNFQKYDLGVLQFESEEVYEVASLSETPLPANGETVYAAGFPYEVNRSNGEFIVTTGTVNLISDLSFRGGYQIGYTNNVKQGMSGGPLLNTQGQIIGINGRHKYPAWGNPYIFDNGTVASVEKKEEMSQYSWAIPIQTFLQFVPELIGKKQ